MNALPKRIVALAELSQRVMHGDPCSSLVLILQPQDTRRSNARIVSRNIIGLLEQLAVGQNRHDFVRYRRLDTPGIKLHGVLRIEDAGSNAPMFLLPNAGCANLNPGVTTNTGTINNRQYGHLCVDVAGNDTRDAFAVRTNSGVGGGALNAIPLVVNCANRVGINNVNPSEALDVAGNAKLSGSVYANGGELAAGSQNSSRGLLTGWSGAGGAAPGCIRLASPNGTVWYLFIEDDGTVKVHNALPTSNANGTVVGLQY